MRFNTLFLLAFPLHSFAFQQNNPLPTGLMLSRYQKTSHFWSDMCFLGIDGASKISPPDAAYIHRKIDLSTNIGGEVSIGGGGLGVRLNTWLHESLSKSEEKAQAIAPVEHRIFELYPSLDMTFLNPKGLEITLGLMMHSVLSENEKTYSSFATSDTEYESVTYATYRFGLMRRGSSFGGGLYFIQGKENSRKFSKTIGDITKIGGSDTVAIPTIYGISGDFAVNSTRNEFDIATVQASAFGQTSLNGVHIKDDYIKFQYFNYLPFNIFYLQTNLSYKTLSYANLAFADFDSIPLLNFGLNLCSGNYQNNYCAGIIGQRGVDKASITEFNETYAVKGLGLNFSLFSTF